MSKCRECGRNNGYFIDLVAGNSICKDCHSIAVSRKWQYRVCVIMLVLSLAMNLAQAVGIVSERQTRQAQVTEHDRALAAIAAKYHVVEEVHKPRFRSLFDPFD